MAKLSIRKHVSTAAACIHYLNEVDVAIESVRYTKPGVVEARANKLAEARIGSGTWVEAEAVATGTDLPELCATIIASAEGASVIGAQLEAKRIYYRSLVRQASSAAEMQAALATLRAEVC